MKSYVYIIPKMAALPENDSTTTTTRTISAYNGVCMHLASIHRNALKIHKEKGLIVFDRAFISGLLDGSDVKSDIKYTFWTLEDLGNIVDIEKHRDFIQQCIEKVDTTLKFIVYTYDHTDPLDALYIFLDHDKGISEALFPFEKDIIHLPMNAVDDMFLATRNENKEKIVIEGPGSNTLKVTPTLETMLHIICKQRVKFAQYGLGEKGFIVLKTQYDELKDAQPLYEFQFMGKSCWDSLIACDIYRAASKIVNRSVMSNSIVIANSAWTNESFQLLEVYHGTDQIAIYSLDKRTRKMKKIIVYVRLDH
jgi:hypothetical protein